MRLVAKNFFQKESIDFFDIYTLVRRITTIRVLIAWVAIKKFIIHQIDMKITFLNGDFNKEIYMERPKGLDALISKVCKLTKSLYDLKHASKLWHEKFDKIVRSNEY